MWVRHWVFGEFKSDEALEHAVDALKERGYPRIETYSPFPIPSMGAKLGLGRSLLPAIALAAGLFSAALGFWIQWYTNAWDYPINVGNRPPFGPPAFVPFAYESGILGAVSAVFFSLMIMLRFPRPYHPALELERFKSASRDRFWVSVTTNVPTQAAEAERALHELGAISVASVREKVRR